MDNSSSDIADVGAVEFKMNIRNPEADSTLASEQEINVDLMEGKLSFLGDDDTSQITGDHFHQFITAVEKDDVDTFRSWNSHHQQLLIHGKFDYENSKDSSKHLSMLPKAAYKIPVNLAAGYAAINIVKDFIAKGVDLTRIDIDDNNILHVLALTSAVRRSHEEDYTDVANTILDALDKESLRILCQQENKSGFRPLELAAIEGSFAVYNCLLQKPGYICGDAQYMGLSKFYPYDITDYSPSTSFSRVIRSPLKLLIHVDKPGFRSMKQFKTMDLPLVQQWVEHHIKLCLPFLVVWWLVRVSFLCLVAFVDPTALLYNDVCSDYSPDSYNPHKPENEHSHEMEYEQCTKLGNYTNNDLDTLLQANQACEIWAYIMLAIDILEVIIRLGHSDRRRAYKQLYRRTFAAYTRSYRIAQFLLYVVVVVGPRIAPLWSGGNAYQVLLFIKAFQLPLCLFSLLFFIEFLPVLGIFAITLQRMMKSLLVFLFFLLPVKLLFSQYFIFLAPGNGFANNFNGTYLLFLMDMGSFDFGTNPSLVVKIVHVFYFLLMVVLLFNYLIAVLSLVADETDEDRQLLIQLRRLQMCSEIFERVAFWFWTLIQKIRRKKNPTMLYVPAHC